MRRGEGRGGAGGEPEPGRLRLAMDHGAYEALWARPVNTGIVLTSSAEYNNTTRS